jgi:hypothetical protein
METLNQKKKKKKKKIQTYNVYLSIHRRSVSKLFLHNGKKESSQFEQHICFRRRKFKIVRKFL